MKKRKRKRESEKKGNMMSIKERCSFCDTITFEVSFYSESDKSALNPPLEIKRFSLLCVFPGSYSS